MFTGFEIIGSVPQFGFEIDGKPGQSRGSG
jgi:hypothetical protein